MKVETSLLEGPPTPNLGFPKTRIERLYDL